MADYLMGLPHVVKMLNKSSKRGDSKASRTNDSEPKKEEEDQYGAGISSKVIKKCIEAMSKNIDHMIRQNDVYYHGLMTKRVIEQIRHDELSRVTESLKEIDLDP